MPSLRAEAGSRPAASPFLSRRRKKGTKERATLQAASLRFATGNLRCSVRGRHRRTHCAASQLRSDNCGESEHEVRVSCGTRTRPLPCAPRRILKGTRRAHPGHRCARPQRAQALCAAQRQAERSDGPCGCSAVPPLLAAPAAGRLRGDTGVEAPVLRCLARRGCPNGAPQARSEFCGAPRNRHAAGLPRSEAQGSQTEGRLLFGDFLLAKQEKVTAPPGAHPGSRPSTRHAAQIGERAVAPGSNQLNPPVWEDATATS